MMGFNESSGGMLCCRFGDCAARLLRDLTPNQWFGHLTHWMRLPWCWLNALTYESLGFVAARLSTEVHFLPYQAPFERSSASCAAKAGST
jgi:hypothetical protein